MRYTLDYYCLFSYNLQGEMDSRDWSVCIICGMSGGELRCPVDSHQNNGIEIYDNFLKPVDEFRRLDSLPMKLSFQDAITPHIWLCHRV